MNNLLTANIIFTLIVFILFLQFIVKVAITINLNVAAF